MITIKRQMVLNRVAIILQSTKPQERRDFFNFYYNWNIANSGLKELPGDSAYFVTTKNRYVRGMASFLFGKLVENGNSKAKVYKKHPEILKKRAQLAAQSKLNELKEVHYISNNEVLSARLKEEIV